MAPRTAAMSVYVVCFMVAAFTASAQDVNHGRKPRDPPLGSLSPYNTFTKHYEPVTSDSRYTYYRIKVSLAETFSDNFNPDPTTSSVVQVVISGDVIDNTTSIKVGTFDSSSVTTAVNANKELTYLATLAVELGPNGDDTLIIGSAFERANFIEAPTDFDLAILGGTGRYKGATGEVFHSGPRVTTAWNVYVAEVAVPKFKRF